MVAIWEFYLTRPKHYIKDVKVLYSNILVLYFSYNIWYIDTYSYCIVRVNQDFYFSISNFFYDIYSCCDIYV